MTWREYLGWADFFEEKAREAKEGPAEPEVDPEALTPDSILEIFGATHA
jgi:hypothetical protein